VLATGVWIAVLPGSEPAHRSRFDLLTAPLVLEVVGVGALLGWIGSLFTLLRTRLRVTVPVVAAAAALTAAQAPLGFPLFDALLMLVAAWTAMIACRLASEPRTRPRSGPPPPRPGLGR
jgi:hypothetical protein